MFPSFPRLCVAASLVLLPVAVFAQQPLSQQQQPASGEGRPEAGRTEAGRQDAGRGDGVRSARRALMASCRGELQSLCGDVEKGGGRKIQCLKANESKLGTECKTAIASMVALWGQRRAGGLAVGPGGGPGGGQVWAQTGAGYSGEAGSVGMPSGPVRPMAVIRRACASDIATVCAGVEKGQGRIGQCLKANEAKLSPGCQSARAELKAKAKELRQAVRQACAVDAQSLCATTEKPKQAVMCLRERQAQASPGCQAALANLPMRGGKHGGRNGGWRDKADAAGFAAESDEMDVE